VSTLQLELGGLHLHLTLDRREVEGDGGPYLDWLICTARVRDPHFSGEFQWEVMPGELLQLARYFEQLDTDLAARQSLLFRCAESNVELDFSVTTGGAVGVRYRLGGPLADDSRLQGETSFEPAALSALAAAVRAFVGDSQSGAQPD